ncbi:MAG: phospho-sugar mutase, partial [Myxococcales bacterium]|nr:phospho-sugar mutase [Myxococcales bacterium]
GAMDLVLDLAREKAADLVLANDPDADRLAVAVRDRDGTYVMLTGNEIGCLLAHLLLTARKGASHGKGQALVISTVVSSPMLGAIAAHHGARWEQTLTGFKWIANRAIELSAKGEADFVFGYEEALGYCVGNLVRDKDGVSAATVMATLAAKLKREGRTLLDERETMWRTYGLFMSQQVSWVLPGSDGLTRIGAAMKTVRGRHPTHIGGLAVETVVDLGEGRRIEGGKEMALEGPRSNVLLFGVEGGHRIMLRPSGTEPKLKFYYDVRIAAGEGEAMDDAIGRGRALLKTLAEDFRTQVEGSDAS